MARKPRIEYPGAFYHIMCRGNNREYILTDEEKPEYLRIIEKYKKRYKFKVYAYCIMDNHAHLLLETGEIPLSKIMQGIQQSYTQYYNKKYGRTGHVFQQRYKALLCDKERYLWQLIKYIHYNPLEAGMNQGLDYKWSSHKNYISGTGDALVDVDRTLIMLSQNLSAAQKHYRDLMCVKPNEGLIQECRLESEFKDDLDLLDRKSRKDGVEIDTIINELCEEAAISVEDILRRTKIQKFSDVRKAIVILSEKYTDISNKELAAKLNIPPSMISKIKNGTSRGTDLVDEIIKKIENKGIFQA